MILLTWAAFIWARVTGWIENIKAIFLPLAVRRPSPLDDIRSRHGRVPKVTKINDSLFVLKAPEPPVTPEVDILFFHGFHSSDSVDAHLKTWEIQLDDGPCLWPSTWLVEEFPNARVLCVSYDAVLKPSSEGTLDLHNVAENLASDFMQANIGQTPNCPVVLVGHCFGGLVMKELCLRISETTKLARSEAKRIELESFLSRVRGIFYYGTPHKGSPCVDKAETVRANPLLNYFKILSTEASRMNSKFSHLCEVHPDWMVRGLGESIPTSQGLFRGTVVASEASSRDGDAFNVVKADHVSITKPESKTDMRFYSLTGLLRSVIDTHKVEVLGHQCLGLPDYPMGLSEGAQNVEGLLRDEGVVGIVGMGGIGKTALAKRVYNNISGKFEYTCFLENVKLVEHGLEDLVRTHFYCKGKILGKVDWEDLKKKKTLITLDDVDAEDQLRVLPQLQQLGDGSKIIVTSRDKDVLGFYAKRGVYEVNLLDMRDAKTLFCRHAFDREDVPGPASPTSHLPASVIEVVQKCDGLPLTLEVVGRYLRNHTANASIWKETIDRLGKAQPVTGGRNDRVWAKLRVSFDALVPQEQEMFVEAATLFSGCPLHYALAAWSTGIGEAETRWANLVSRSMVKVSSGISDSPFDGKLEDCVWVHEQLRDLGRSLSKGHIGRRHETAAADEALKMMNSNEVIEGTTSLTLCYPSVPLQLDLFARSKNLKYLFLDLVDHEGELDYSQRKLSLLRWDRPLSEDSPPQFPFGISDMENLAVLEIRHWKVDTRFSQAVGSLANLRVLTLRDLTGLHSLPENFGDLSQLRWLTLESLSPFELPEALGKLSALEELTLCDIPCRVLPDSFGDLYSLVSLTLRTCDNLARLPPSFGRGLKSLQYLSISYCRLLECLPDSVSQLTGLQELVINNCPRLKELGDSFGNLSALQRLELDRCDAIEKLPESLGLLNALRKLNIGGGKLMTLPKNLGLIALKELRIGCTHLPRLPRSFGELARLEKVELWVLSLTAIPDSLRKLSALEELSITSDWLVTLPNDVGQLSSLRTLVIRCDRVEALPKSLGDLMLLQTLAIRSKGLRNLPDTLGQLRSMRKLRIDARRLLSLPENVGQLSSLQEFELICCEREELPGGLDHLPASTMLTLCGRRWEWRRQTMQVLLPGGLRDLSTRRHIAIKEFGFKWLPEEIGKLSSLRRLSLQACYKLESLPDSMGSLSSLTQLDVTHCPRLRTLPDSLGRPVSSVVALPREGARNKEVGEGPASQPSAMPLRLTLEACHSLDTEQLMRSLGWVIEGKWTDWGRNCYLRGWVIEGKWTDWEEIATSETTRHDTPSRASEGGRKGKELEQGTAFDSYLVG